MKPHLLWLIALFGVSVANLPAEELSPEKLEAISARLKSLKGDLEKASTARNTSAGERFLQASVDPKAAVELWKQCEKAINFEREEKRESDFRDWEQSQSDRERDAGFLESLLIQLRYLGLSCKAAEAETIDSIFSDLTTYVETLSQMKELPTRNLLQSVANSTFAQAYDLNALLSRNGSWESVPYSIVGIYEKTILPHLRSKKPEALLKAWDMRIDQQTRLAGTLNDLMDKEESRIRNLEGQDQRDAKRNLQNLIQEDQSRMLRSHDKDDFLRETLPRLKWGKLKDQFEYVDPLAASAGMVALIEELKQNSIALEFYNEFESLITAASSPGAQAPQAIPGTN